MAGNMTAQDHGIEVIQHDDTALITLELIADHGRGLAVFSDRIVFGTYPFDLYTYRVVGWDAEARALILELEK